MFINHNAIPNWNGGYCNHPRHPHPRVGSGAKPQKISSFQSPKHLILALLAIILQTLIEKKCILRWTNMD